MGTDFINMQQCDDNSPANTDREILDAVERDFGNEYIISPQPKQASVFILNESGRIVAKIRMRNGKYFCSTMCLSCVKRPDVLKKIIVVTLEILNSKRYVINKELEIQIQLNKKIKIIESYLYENNIYSIDCLFMKIHNENFHRLKIKHVSSYAHEGEIIELKVPRYYVEFEFNDEIMQFDFCDQRQ